MKHTGCTRNEAIRVLRESNDDMIKQEEELKEKEVENYEEVLEMVMP